MGYIHAQIKDYTIWIPLEARDSPEEKHKVMLN